MIEELKKKFEQRDRVIRIVSKNAAFRAVAIRNTLAVQTAQKMHNLEHIPAFLLARTMTAASMISAFLKGEERVIIEINSEGIVNKVYAEAMQVGECRGFIKFSPNYFNSEFTEKITKIGDILGLGTLKVSRILYNKTEPIVGIIPLINGDISSDIAYYFSQSEQINSAVILDVDFDDTGKIISSGGILVQAMPGAVQEEINNVVYALGKINSFCAELNTEKSLEDILSKILPFEFDIVKNKQVDFFCRCSIANFIARLMLIGIDEIEDMQKKGQNELVCQYCNKHYYLSDADFKNIIGQLKVQQN